MQGHKQHIGMLTAVLTAVFAALPLHAQTSTFRMHVPDGYGFHAMRPEVFEANRTARIDPSAGLDQLEFIGEFVTRYGENPAELPKKLDIDGRYYERVRTRLYAATDGRRLRLVAECDEPHPELMEHNIAPDTYTMDDRLQIFIDSDHDHHDFTIITVWPSGRSEVRSFFVKENHLSWDRSLREIEVRHGVEIATSVEEPGWRMDVTVDLGADSLAGDPWKVVGMNVVRKRGVKGEETTMWCADFNRVNTPLYIGDLYIGDPPVVPSAVELGEVCWGENAGALTAGEDADGIPVDVVSYNYTGEHRRNSFGFSGGRCEFDYHIDPHELMDSAVELHIDGVYWGRYEFGWKRSILLTHRPTGEFRAEKPSAGAHDYYWKFARYVLDRLPKLERSPDGMALLGDGVRVDLRRSDGLERLADIVMRRFPTDEGRIAAATLLLCQQGAMVSSGSGARIGRPFDGLGILRTGAVFCAAYGELLRDLLRRIKNENGEYFQAEVVNFVPGDVNTFGWPHHWLAGVVYDGEFTLVDSELGLFFVNPEEGRLATLAELLERPELADLSAYGFSQYFKGRSVRHFKVREAGKIWELP